MFAFWFQETAMSLTVPRQRRRRRRKIEVEAERAAKRRNLMEMVAQLRGSQMGAENGQEKVVDLSNASREATSSTSNFSSLTPKFILPNSSTPVSDAFKTQMERLQAGLSCTPTRHLLNGSLIDGEPPMKRRRGRRKNVEGLDLLFMSNRRTSLSTVRKWHASDLHEINKITLHTLCRASPGSVDFRYTKDLNLFPHFALLHEFCCFLRPICLLIFFGFGLFSFSLYHQHIVKKMSSVLAKNRSNPKKGLHWKMNVFLDSRSELPLLILLCFGIKKHPF